MVSHIENRTTSYPIFVDDVEFASSDSASDYLPYDVGEDNLSNIDEDGVYLYKAKDETDGNVFYDSQDCFAEEYPVAEVRSPLMRTNYNGFEGRTDHNELHRKISDVSVKFSTMTEINHVPNQQQSRGNRTAQISDKSNGNALKAAATSTALSNAPLQITQETIDKVRETELEDILMNARDISEPDPQSKMSFCSRPSKLIEGTFRHLLSVKELHSTTGAFKYRSIEVKREQDADLGFSVRQGDGWEKREGIFVSRLSLGSPFDLYELMSIGEEVVKINNVDVRKMNVDDVVRLMHLPEKLTITVKILTPFSKKRVAKSRIARNTLSKKFTAKSKRTQDSNYKIANLKIGKSVGETLKSNGSESSGSEGQTSSSSSTNRKLSSPSHIQVPVTPGRSPYRTLPNGFGTPTRHLSPIREAKSEAQISSAGDVNNSSISWSDQRSNKSGAK